MTTKFKIGDNVVVKEVEDGMLVNIDPKMKVYVGHHYKVIGLIQDQPVWDGYWGNYSSPYCTHYVLGPIRGRTYKGNASWRVDRWVFTEDMLELEDDNA